MQLAIGHLLERLDGDLGWDAAECILDQIFPDRGEGPFSSLGRTMSPNAWRTTIKKGLKDAFQRLANGDLS